jgi:hypothetical protein
LATRPRKRPQFRNQPNLEEPWEGSIVGEADQECADWKLQIELAEERNEKWERKCKRIVKRYREDRGSSGGGGDSDSAGAGSRRMNIFWSNVETLTPSVYGREPVPIAERRFLDQDKTGRVGSQILERAMRYEMGFCGFHDTLQQSVQDYLIVGRGVAWLRYKPIIGAATSLTDMGDDELTDRSGMPADPEDDPNPEQDAHNESDDPTAQPSGEKLLSASLEVDYVHWADFLHSHARFWKENTWVARRLYLSRKDLIDDFGEEVGEAVPLEMTPEMKRNNRAQSGQGLPDSLKKAVVYEIWDKPTRKVYTVAKGYGKFLEEPRDDPLNMENFFPCPKPLFATMTNDTLEPVPDYIEYQDQALEIDQLTNRIDLLIKALKVAGVYDASQKQLARLLDEGHENKLIPIPNWAAFATKGGLASAISFMPIKEISDVLQGLFAARDKIKQDLFEITGLSDIIRGQADPRETAEAVQTKGRWGSLRLQARQANVARFCRDIIAMMGEIIAEHYPVETLVNVSGAMYDEGIGGSAPVAPKAPQSQPNPMLGHNGGPPMGGISAPGGPTPGGGGMPPPPMAGGAILPSAQAPINPSPLHPPMLAGMPPGAGLVSSPGLAPGAGAPPNPMMQYQMQMAQYAHDMATYQAEKQAIITKAIDLLRQDKLRGFRIDIETDSTIQTDQNEDKQARTEFLKATTSFIEEAFKIGAQSPEAVPMLGKMLLFGVRGFRAGRDLESTIEEFVDKMEKDAAQKAKMPPPPNPELQKAQVELQAVQAKSSAETQKAQIDAQASAADNQRDMAAKQADAQIAAQKAQMELAAAQQKAQFEAADNAAKLRELQLKMAMMERDHAQKTELMTRSHSQELERSTAEHAMHMERSKEARKANGAAK